MRFHVSFQVLLIFDIAATHGTSHTPTVSLSVLRHVGRADTLATLLTRLEDPYGVHRDLVLPEILRMRE